MSEQNIRLHKVKGMLATEYGERHVRTEYYEEEVMERKKYKF